jgi:hypothetical protein
MKDRMNVLGFDNWTRGKHHFEFLVDAFAREGMDLTLVHLGSWGNDPDRPKEEWSGKLRLRDISYYGSSDYRALLDAEKPAAVLLFSTDTFAHRAFMRYCKQRKIPTAHIYHGIVNAQKVVGGQLYKSNFFAQLKFVLEKIPKALRFVWPSYIKSLLQTGAGFGDWKRFGADIAGLALGRTNPVSAPDARADHCGVYIKADIAHAVGRYGYTSTAVSAVGNPDLVRFGLQPTSLGWVATNDTSANRDVMYIDTGLIFTGWVFTSHQDFIDHMIETRRGLADAGMRLLFKPHPDHGRAGVLEKLAAEGIEICSTEDFVPRLQSCRAAIVETSTAAIVPALIGLPLLLAQYGKLTSLNFGEVLTGYPRARYLADLSEIDSLLETERAGLDLARLQDWIELNSGPLPASDMPDRVASIFTSLIALSI